MNRREFLAMGGTIVVGFALPAHAQKLPGDLARAPLVDAWIGVAPNGRITVFTGKVELGQGIKTALMQIAAEQLGVGMDSIDLVTADTARTPNEGYTAGSHSMQDSATAILYAAAQAREILAAHGALHVPATAAAPIRRARAVMGRSVPRVDIPGKVTGAPSYVQDLRLPGMLHARVVRQPSYGATLRSFDAAAARAIPGVVEVVRNGSFLAVAATREWSAIRAMRALKAGAAWEETAHLPTDVRAALERLPAKDEVIAGEGARFPEGARVVEASYFRPYQMHASIGPSCAVARLAHGEMTVWTHSQGVYPLRRALAQLLGIAPGRVRCIHVEGAGCYGHNGADDAAADAALIAQALPGKPIRVQWMREDEHAWEPYGPAMLTRARAALDGTGKVLAWRYEVLSNTHSTRPGPAGNLLAGRSIAKPFPEPAPRAIPQPEGGGDRNAIPLYRIPNVRVVNRFIPEMPLRVSALRSLGAYMNVFSIESFMDELAAAAGADPVEFRLRHLEDARAREVVGVASERFGWSTYRKAAGRGRGFGFARYKNLAAYAAVALEIALERESGELHVLRAVAAVDSGEAVNPDGIRNQVEGAIVQSLSWSTMEAVTFNARRITSRDWGRYPIVRFSHAPGSIEVHVIDRPGAPFLGTGEAAQGPTAAALANALADASGVRVRDLPLDARRPRTQSAAKQ